MTVEPTPDPMGPFPQPEPVNTDIFQPGNGAPPPGDVDPEIDFEPEGEIDEGAVTGGLAFGAMAVVGVILAVTLLSKTKG
jgi:hypothetical protein